MTYKNEILKLKEEECWTDAIGDCGKAEVWLKNGTYFLFEIPLYGGRPQFSGAFFNRNIDALINKIDSWT